MKIFTYLLKKYLILLSIFFIGRVILSIFYFDKLSDVSSINIIESFIYGFRMDTILTSILLVIPLFILSFFPKNYEHLSNLILKYYFLIVFSAVIFIEIATFPFIDQYDIRPNYIFVEYISFPKQIFDMIVNDYLIELLIAIGVLIIFIFMYIKKYDLNSVTEILNIKYKNRILVFIPIFILLFIGARSSFGSRPANLSDALWSHNRTINEITKNSIHSIVTDVYRNYKYADTNNAKQYGDIDIKVALKNVKELLNINNREEFSLKRVEKTHFKTNKAKNLVIFLQESLGGRFVEAVGGEKGITPNFNKLSKEGLLFTNAFSNGTRSNRAIVGLTTGLYSLPGKQLLKRNKAQNGFFSIASLLKPYGYQTSFIYGGEARFDNMKNFFMGNNFYNVIEGKDFKNPKYVGTWGVCDEELAIRANEEFKKLYSKKQKFASLMFTLSSHAPYDIPKGKVEPYVGDEAKLKTAIKYADFSLGKFFELAKKENYFKDTVFIVIADHNVKYSKGNDSVPVSEFHIPALIIADSLTPMKYEEIATQPDILATALDLLGLDLNYPIMGRSVFDKKKKDFALLQFHKNYALVKGNNVSVLRPDKKPLTYKYINHKMFEKEHDKKLEEYAISLVNVIDYLYNNKLYR